MDYEYNIKNLFFAKYFPKLFNIIQGFIVRLSIIGLALQAINQKAKGQNFVRCCRGRVRRYISSAGTQFKYSPWKYFLRKLNLEPHHVV